MRFKYQAKTKDGELQVGYVEAGSRDGAASILTSHELFILSIESEGAPGITDRINTFLNRVRRKDMVIFSRQLATLLSAQLPLNTALKILRAQTVNKVLNEALLQVTEDIDAGLSFSQALERQGSVFPSYYSEMVRAGEVTGNLNDVTSFLADYIEREGDLASKAASALIYPGIVLGLFVVVAFILLAFVFPSIGTVFAQNNVSLPWYTEALLSIGNFLSAWWFVIIVVVGAVTVISANYFSTKEGQAFLDDMKLKLPITKNVYTPVILARFGNAAALLVHGNIPLAQSLEIISHMVGNVGYEDVVRVLTEDVRQGKLLSESIAAYPKFFPPLVSQMISVGETTGKIEEMFARLAGIYTREADRITSNLVDLIQPILMIGMGLMVGILFASILIPLYSLTANIH